MRFSAQHLIILTSAFFAGVTDIFSQSYFHSPNDTLIENTLLDAQVTMNITQVHPTNDTLHFYWNKLSVDMPIEWEATICDNSNCYTALENSGITLPVLPGDDGLMLIHCTPHVTEGTAIIRYTIYEENSPTQVDTLTWIINATSAGTISLAENTPLIWTKDNVIHIEGNDDQYNSIRIFDISGQLLFKTTLNGESVIAIPTFNSMYGFIELKGDHANYKQKISLK